MIANKKGTKLELLRSLVRKLKSLLVLLALCWAEVSMSQNLDTNYNEPITETIHKIEQDFHVKIEDKKNLLEGKKLDYADWRIRKGNLEISLTNILAPFDLTFFKETDSTYAVRKFEYYRVSHEIGKERLHRLSAMYHNKEQWEERKKELKDCMYRSLLLDKAPPTPDKEPILTPKRIYEGYSVENIGLEVLPGVYATGSIYKPYPLKGKSAVIISPNGHFKNGRYRRDQQMRSASLARMGAIVVTYDLFAWGESELQFPVETHRNSIGGPVQILEAIRLLDYVLTLPEADSQRVGVTGASGGGSITLFLTALDDRIKVSVPVVMVSSHFSGGCGCETGEPIHLCGNGTNNAEIAAMAAPRPQLIISDGDDWTKTVPKVEFPFIKRTYGFYNAENKVENVHLKEDRHDYKYSKRKAMYIFMAKYLGLDLDKIKNKKGEIDESECVREDNNALKVFGDNGERLPKDALHDINKLNALFGEPNYKK